MSHKQSTASHTSSSPPSQGNRHILATGCITNSAEQWNKPPATRASWTYTHVSQCTPGHSPGPLFVLALAHEKRPPQLLLCIYGHHAHACAPWAQTAFSEYRKTCTDPVAVLGLRERQERSPGKATPRPRTLPGLRHPRPGRHKGQTHLLLLHFFFPASGSP